MGKTLHSNFLTRVLCGMKNKHKGRFHNGVKPIGKKQIKSKWTWKATAGISKSGSAPLLLYTFRLRHCLSSQKDKYIIQLTSQLTLINICHESLSLHFRKGQGKSNSQEVAKRRLPNHD